jgi:hypothetical protein
MNRMSAMLTASTPRYPSETDVLLLFELAVVLGACVVLAVVVVVVRDVAVDEAVVLVVWMVDAVGPVEVVEEGAPSEK